MEQNFSDLNLSENLSTPTHPGQEQLQEYSSWSEMAESIRHSQVGNIGVMAAALTAILFAYIMYRTEDTETRIRVLALLQFAVTEVFILAVFRFLLT